MSKITCEISSVQTKEITLYSANDGKVFITKGEARNHNLDIRNQVEIDDLMSILGRMHDPHKI